MVGFADLRFAGARALVCALTFQRATTTLTLTTTTIPNAFCSRDHHSKPIPQFTNALYPFPPPAFADLSNQNSKSATIEMYAPSSYNDTVTGETLSSVSEKSDSYSNEESQPDYMVIKSSGKRVREEEE